MSSINTSMLEFQYPIRSFKCSLTIIADIFVITWSNWSKLHRDSNLSRRVNNGTPRHRRAVVNQVQISFWNEIKKSSHEIFKKLNTFLMPTWRHRLSLQPFRDSHFYITGFNHCMHTDMLIPTQNARSRKSEFYTTTMSAHLWLVHFIQCIPNQFAWIIFILS